MVTKTITAVAIALGLVAASAGSAGAGAGGGGVKGKTELLLQCYNINAPLKSDNTLFQVNDVFIDAGDVNLPGTPQILCVSASADDASHYQTLSAVPADANSIVCYAPQVSNTAPPTTTITLYDPLTTGTQSVKVSSTKYVCIEAFVSGCAGCPGTFSAPDPLFP